MKKPLSQVELIYNLLKDGKPHRTDEIVRKVYKGEFHLARLGSRIFDIKSKHNCSILGWHDPINPRLYWYQMQ